MKCINRFMKKSRLLCVVCIAAIFISGCSTEKIANAYDVYSNDYTMGNNTYTYFGSNLCVTNNVNYGTDQTHSQVAEGAGLFNIDTNEVLYSQNIFDRLYPASTTKILTAYIIIRYGNLDDMVTVSANAANQEESSSVCGINEGDVISVRELLYGLMLVSGNDAAVALAEYYSGSVEAFAEVMNEEALKMGASNSHFVNPSGYPDDNHYTTVYDMYLIFSNAVSLQAFQEIINTKTIDVTYSSASGSIVEKTYNNSNHYIAGTCEAPEGISVIGGKTGTTYDAGYCLVLLSTNEKGERLISIVFKADGKSNLYLLMNDILSSFGN